MKSVHWKWWLLGVLAVVMIFIWYDAFDTMYPESTELQLTTPSRRRSAGGSTGERLEYQAPKVNPFKRPTAAPAQPTQPRRQAQRPEQIPELNSQYRLTGILGGSTQSQAVIALGERSSVLSIGDSLDTWELRQITARLAVFEHGKSQDTLFLYTDD